jgi:hypothetical protein
MALQDPTDPTGYFDPAIADALAAQSDPYGFEWPPAHWQDAPAPDQQIGGTMGVVENAAAPSIAGMEGDLPSEAAIVAGNIATPRVEKFDPLALQHENDAPPPLPPPVGYMGAGEVAPEQRGDLPAQAAPMDIQGIRPEKSAEELGVELGQDPIKLMLAEQKYADEQKKFADDQAASARIRDEMKAQENYQRQLDVQEKTRADMESLNNEAIALSKTKIDPDRWYRNRSTTGKIGAWVAAIVGGLVSGRTGGPNQGLANIMKMIDDDVDAQKADLQNQQQSLGMRRGIIADSYARSGDAFRAAEAFRMASYERVKADLMTQQSQFDPKSARAIQLGRMIQDVGARQAAAQQAALERTFKLHTADAELQGKLLANEAARRKLSGIGAGGSPKLSPEQWKAQGYTNVPPMPMNPAEFKSWQEGQKRDADVGQARQAPADKTRELGIPGLVQKDGQPFLARDKTIAADLTNKLDKSKQIISIIDRIDAIRDRVGGESSWGNSDEYNQLKVLEKEALLLKKSGTQGMSSDSDMENITASLGASDVTSFRSKAAGLREARRRTEQAIKSELKSNGFDNLDLLKFDRPKVHENTDGETKIKQRAYGDDLIEESGGKRPKRDINTGEVQFE